MEAPGELVARLERLSAECGVAFELTRFWANEFRPGWFCRFRGVLHESRALTVQVVGSLAVDLAGERQDEVELFLFANGVRLGRLERPYEYLHRRGGGPFLWADLDEGFRAQTTLGSIAMDDDD